MELRFQKRHGADHANIVEAVAGLKRELGAGCGFFSNRPATEIEDLREQVLCAKEAVASPSPEGPSTTTQGARSLVPA